MPQRLARSAESSKQRVGKAYLDGYCALVGSSKKHMPKSKCCVSKKRCKRCPIRMLKEGTLPNGYTVKQRKLVKVAA